MPENVITIDGRLKAVLSTPENCASAMPAVLLLHGFGSHKDEVLDMYKTISHLLANNGIISLRIDFSGWGESSGNMEETSIDQLVDDTQVTYDYLLSLSFVDHERIGICGFSLGAAISALSSISPRIKYNTMALISPVGNLTGDFNIVLGKEVYTQLENATDIVDIDLGWRKIKLKRLFVDSLTRFFPVEAIKSFKGSLFVIAGSKDFSARHVISYIDNSSSTIKNYKIIDGADHVFDAFDSEKSTMQSVVLEVTNWFNNTIREEIPNNPSKETRLSL